MQIVSTNQSEIRVTLEAAADLINGLGDPDFDIRNLLLDKGFMRAANASQASIDRLRSRLDELAVFMRSLHNLDDEDDAVAARAVNELLTELAIAPSVVAHDGSELHIHWTPSTATFDDQVVADILMAVAQEICENGTIRFGSCGADDCEDLFYDGTRNRSRRFCNDPRCASKTHTADHRARNRNKAAGRSL